jgi:flagellar hook protein FlgE
VDPPPDYVRETVDRIDSEYAFKANAAVVKTADQMVGTLIDIWA